MGGCAAVNCCNSTKKGFKLFRFPSDPERRKLWKINCRRDDWEPSPNDRLCHVHFEDSQFESNRQDNWKKLKQNATPTIFNIPNPPSKLTNKRIKGIGMPKPGSILESFRTEPNQLNQETEDEPVAVDIKVLLAENAKLKEENQELLNRMATFLTAEQMSVIGKNSRSIKCWSKEGLLKALKLRFALGKNGFEYLRSTGYPAPSYSTLNRRIQGIHIEFGVLHSILNLLKAKIDAMPSNDKLCCLSVDEMEISSNLDFDTANKSFVGQTTLGKKTVANHFTVVLLRGLKSPWKQIVAIELTGPSTSGEEMKCLLTNTVNAATEIGIQVKISVSDMGSNNTGMWKSLGTSVTRQKRITTYDANGKVIHNMADVPHLLKNLRSAFLKCHFFLAEDICRENDLPSPKVSSGYVKQLYIEELNSESSLRSLHHLRKNHLFPTHFNTMNVAFAVQLFSNKTAAAIEKAVSLRQLPKEALTTAWFIRVVDEWFTLMTARHRKKGITLRNCERKFQFLENFIEIFQSTTFVKGWKPFQSGIIMSSISVINLTKELFEEGYQFFLPGRLTQDALENVFSQIRRKAGIKPTALQAKSAVKMICVSQFISDVKNTNYAADSDYHLFDSNFLPSRSTVATHEIEDDAEVIDFDQPSTSTVATHEVEDGAEVDFDQPSTSVTRSINKVAADENDIYYIAGSTLNEMLKKKNVCDQCKEAAKVVVDNKEPNVPYYRQYLNNYCNMGGLKSATSGIYRICRETERVIQQCTEALIAGEQSLDALIDAISSNCSDVILPNCCQLKQKIISHYFVVRCIGIRNHFINRKAHEKSFSSATLSKKQKRMA